MRIACIVASVPDTVMRARSTQPVSSFTSSIARTSSSLVRLKLTPLAHALVDVVVDPLVAVAEDHRAVAHPQVDELVAVDVPDLAALAAIDIDRAFAPGPEVRVGATGQRLERAPVQRRLGVAADRGRGPGGGFRGHQVPLPTGFGKRAWRRGPWDACCAIRDGGRAHRGTARGASSTRLSSASAPVRRRIPRRRTPIRAERPFGVPPGGRRRVDFVRMPAPDPTVPSATGCASPDRPSTRRWHTVITSSRRRDRRRRVHRAVDRARPDRHRSGPAGRGARGRDRGLRRERPQRRLLRGEPDPRPGQRHQALPRRAAAPGAGRHRQPARPDRLHARPRHRLRPRGDRHARPGRPAVPGRGVPGVGRRGGRAHGEPSNSWTATAARAEVHSPLWQAGLYRPPGRDVLLDPAKLCRGLARVAASAACPSMSGPA